MRSPRDRLEFINKVGDILNANEKGQKKKRPLFGPSPLLAPRITPQVLNISGYILRCVHPRSRLNEQGDDSQRCRQSRSYHSGCL